MFYNARLKLTLWYIGIAGIISLMFSIALYSLVSHEIERFERMARNRMERRILEQLPLNPFPLDDTGLPKIPEILRNATPEILEEARQRIIYILIGVNGVVILLSGALGYILSGQTLKPIIEMLESQKRFVSDASHELKTPLTSLKSAFEVFLRGDKKTMNEAVQIMEESVVEVDMLEHLSESLLTLSRLENASSTLHMQSISIMQCIQDAIKIVSAKAETKHIHISEIRKDATIRGDKQKITELFVILFDNAVKYGKENGNIDISIKKTSSDIHISVKDDGIGIHKKDLPYIFDRFFRSDHSRTAHAIHGYGLGLSIAKEIVVLHRGTIEVESEINMGTKFIVSLKLK